MMLAARKVDARHVAMAPRPRAEVTRSEVIAVIERLRGTQGFEFERPPALPQLCRDAAQPEVHDFRLLCPHLAVLCWLKIVFGVPGLHVPGELERIPQARLGASAGFTAAGKVLFIQCRSVPNPHLAMATPRCSDNTHRRLGCKASSSVLVAPASDDWAEFNRRVLVDMDELAAEFARLNPSLFAKEVR